MEDKQKICDLLCTTLQATRGYKDLVSLHYEFDHHFGEWVTATFGNGRFKRICVSADSGQAMIRDIINRV